MLEIRSLLAHFARAIARAILQSPKLVMILHRFCKLFGRGAWLPFTITQEPPQNMINRNNRQHFSSSSCSISRFFRLFFLQYTSKCCKNNFWDFWLRPHRLDYTLATPTTKERSAHCETRDAAEFPFSVRTLVVCCYRDSVLIIHCIESSSSILVLFVCFFVMFHFSSLFLSFIFSFCCLFQLI